MNLGCPGRYTDPGAAARLASSPPPRRALFLDRDGVINVDRGYVHRPDQVAFVDGIFDLCAAARDSGWLTIVATNQAGIGRGLYTESQFLEFTGWMHGEFERRGVPLSATYYCPHHPVSGRGPYLLDCPCRKPAPGMLQRAIADFAIDAAGSWLVGDKAGDIRAGRAAGVGTCLLLGPDPLPGEGGEKIGDLADALRRWVPAQGSA